MSAVPTRLTLWPTVCLLLATNLVAAGPIRPGFDAAALPVGDDVSSGSVDLGFAVNFFGQSFASAYVNTNGNISFGAPLADFTPVPLGQLRQAVIAPFFADVDTTNGGQIRYGTDTADGRSAFAATWTDVGHYGANTDGRNTFQAVLVDRSDTGAGNFDLEFNYARVQWEAGDFNGGIGGVGGSTGRVGAAASGTFYELPGSGVPGAFLDTGYAALAARLLGSDTPGRSVLHARDGTFEEVRTPRPEERETPPSVAGAPEPGTMALAVIGLAAVVLRRRRMTKTE